MNYHLEMNYLMSEIRHVTALNTCIGPNNSQEFGWVAKNINNFRMQSIEFYHSLLYAFLMETGMRLYAFELYQDNFYHTHFQEVSIDSVNLSLLDQCNKFILIFSKLVPTSLCFFENQDVLFETMYKKGYTLIEIKDYFAEGNSMTFYCQDNEVLSQVEKIAKTVGFVNKI